MKYSSILATLKDAFLGGQRVTKMQGAIKSWREGQLKGGIVPLETWEMWLLSTNLGSCLEARVGGVTTEAELKPADVSCEDGGF